MCLTSATPLLVFSQPIAFVVSKSGDVNIQQKSPDSKLLQPECHLYLLNKRSEIFLIFRDGRKKLFRGKLRFKVTKHRSAQGYFLEPLDAVSKIYLKKNTLDRIYSPERIAGSLGHEVDTEETTSNIDKDIMDQINKTNILVKDDLFRALIQGDIYQRNELNNVAVKLFRKHYKLWSEEVYKSENKED